MNSALILLFTEFNSVKSKISNIKAIRIDKNDYYNRFVLKSLLPLISIARGLEMNFKFIN